MRIPSAVAIAALHLAAACDGSVSESGMEASAAACANGLDDDSDMASDCADAGCAAFCGDAGTGSASACGDVPVTGRCVSGTEVEYCGVPTGEAEPTIARAPCAADEICDDSGSFARCRLTTECRTGDVECLDATSGRHCVDARWVLATCPGTCVHTAIGDGCAPGVATRALSARVAYELRVPNATLTDWGALGTVPAQGFLVVSFDGTSALDAVVTGGGAESGGTFTVRVPAEPTADDRIAVLAVGLASNGELAFVVADPGWPASETPVVYGTQPPEPRAWAWVFATASVTDGQTLRIAEASGSGAARVFDYLRYVFATAERFYSPTEVQSVVVWLGVGTRWTCGACFWAVPTRAFDLDFQHQVYLAGGSDAGYWSDSTTAHELGHYAMQAHGRAVGEGGLHHVMVPSHPGLAWSEGWATYFSADVQNTPLQVRKQMGTFWWFDIDARSDYQSSVWQAPTAEGGLLQMIIEVEVSAMLWALRSEVGREALWAALADPRVRVPPFERGYTARRWTDPMHPEIYADTGASAPFFADYLDALVCRGGATADQVDAVTDPAVRYPYPSGSPLCR